MLFFVIRKRGKRTVCNYLAFAAVAVPAAGKMTAYQLGEIYAAFYIFRFAVDISRYLLIHCCHPPMRG